MTDTREQAPEEFHQCARPCWQDLEHTYAYSSCAVAGQVTDAVDAAVTVLGPVYLLDGRKAIEATDIPLIALLPWTRHLPVKERWNLLDDVAASPEPARCLLEWKITAETVWAVPHVLDALTRPLNLPEDAEVVPPPPLPAGPPPDPGSYRETQSRIDTREAVAVQLILTERKNRDHPDQSRGTAAGDPAGPEDDPQGEGPGRPGVDPGQP